MDMLRALEVLKNDLDQLKKIGNKTPVVDEVLHPFTDGYGIPKGRMLQFYGLPDCGKTAMAREIIADNRGLSFVYISSKADSVKKMNFFNTTVFRSSIFEDIIDFISKIERDVVDIIIIDDIHTMLSKEELLSAFTKKLNTHEIFNKYIKRLSLLAAQKNTSIIIFNSVNIISGKSRYGFMIDKECVATINIEKVNLDSRGFLDVSLKPVRNLMTSRNITSTRVRTRV